MILKQVEDNLVSLDQIVQSKKEFQDKNASDATSRLKDITKSMNKHYSEAEMYILGRIERGMMAGGGGEQQQGHFRGAQWRSKGSSL